MYAHIIIDLVQRFVTGSQVVSKLKRWLSCRHQCTNMPIVSTLQLVSIHAWKYLVSDAEACHTDLPQ